MNEQLPMNEPMDATSAIESVNDTMDTFLLTGSVSAVYGEPIQQGDQTIIPAAEVLSIAGFGVGYGYGQGTEAAREGGEPGDTGSGGGGGGGGGGRILSRPVAVIIATPDGVRVKPVVDVTKIVLAWITALGFIMATLMRMRTGRIVE